MNSLEEKMKLIEGYCEVVLASEREKLPEIERLKQQMESFEEDRGTSEQFTALLWQLDFIGLNVSIQRL